MTVSTASCNESWLLRGQIPQNTSSDASSDDWVRVAGIVVGVFDICVGSIGNLLTIIAILGNPKLRGTFHIFIVNLCFVDFATATFMMPFNVASYVQRSWPFGNHHITCALQAFFYYCCGYSSVVCLVVITVNRYIGILFPHNYEEIFSTKTIMATIAFSWLFAPAVMSVVFFIGDESGVPGYGWIPKYSLCVFKTDGKNEVLRKYMLFTRVLFQGVPLILMIALYSHIFYSVRKSGENVARMSLRSAESDVGNPSHVATPNATPLCARKNILIKNGQVEVTSLTSLEDIGRLGLRTLSVPSMMNRSAVSFENNGSDNGSGTPDSSRRFGLDVISPSVGISPVADHIRPKPEKTSKYATSLHETIRRRKKMDSKLLFISLTICLVFSLMFYPSAIINLFPCSQYFNPSVHKCASFITWFNSCVNPIIYCAMNPKLREHYKNILESFRRKLRRRVQHVDETLPPVSISEDNAHARIEHVP